MSDVLGTVDVGASNTPVSVASFSGGQSAGEMYQLTLGDSYVQAEPREIFDALYFLMRAARGDIDIQTQLLRMAGSSCGHDTLDEETYLHGRCHPESAHWCNLKANVLELRCAKCDKVVYTFTLAALGDIS